MGSGRISNRGSPGRTWSPISRKEVFTMPEILLLTAISRLGRMAPMARAFSTTVPRATGTVLKPLVLLEMDLLYRTAVTPPRRPAPPPRSIPCAWSETPSGPHRLRRTESPGGFKKCDSGHRSRPPRRWPALPPRARMTTSCFASDPRSCPPSCSASPRALDARAFERSGPSISRWRRSPQSSRPSPRSSSGRSAMRDSPRPHALPARPSSWRSTALAVGGWERAGERGRSASRRATGRRAAARPALRSGGAIGGRPRICSGSWRTAPARDS